jgi:hypothetical protein
MLSIRAVAFGLFLVAGPSWAAERDLCSAPSSLSDVQLSLSVKNRRPTFQAGEIVPLVLTFTSTTANRYWADVRNYDRSGRLGIEVYCVEPKTPDPLASYFRLGAFFGGGLGSTRALDTTPFTAEAELNEWSTLAPGHYRVYAVSHRVWRPPDPSEQTPYGRTSEVVRSNTVDLEVLAADPKWQSEQVQLATQALTSSTPPEEARQSARVLRFLNTGASTLQLAKLFGSLNQQQSTNWDLMFGLYGSPYRQLAIDSMHNEITASDHAITSELLRTLVNLQISADTEWDPPPFDKSHPETAQQFWKGRQAHTRELMKEEVKSLIAALPRKNRSARASTLNTVLTAGGDDSQVAQVIRPALIAAWEDLPRTTQMELIQYRWPLIAGPEMLPILRSIVAEPAPPVSTDLASVRNLALQHIHEFDAAAGRTLILRDLNSANTQPSLEVIQLLSPQDIANAIQPAVERITHNNSRNLDYTMLDRYADVSVLGRVQPVFEERLGKWACAPQSAMLRYFLRVAPVYGIKEVAVSLGARKDTHCYSMLLQDLGDQLPQVQEIAIDALTDPDPEVVQDAAISLGRWGTKEAEAPLWARLQRFHKDWAGREDQLRMTPDYQSPGSRGAALEQGLVSAIAGGHGWVCPPDKLARIAELVWTNALHQQIETWTKLWQQGPALINPGWYPEEKPTFSVLQYVSLTEDQLREKLGQFPPGMQLLWQFWMPGQISPPVSMAKQEVSYEQMRDVVEKHGITLGKANHQ